MGFSPLTDVILPTTKHSSRQGRKVTRAIIHNWAGTIGGIERLVYSKDQASANYIILSLPYKMPHDGKRLNGAKVPKGTVLPAGTIIGSVDENYRAWTSGSWEADTGSITFEIQNSERGPSGLISQAAWDSSVRLLVDLATRYKWGTIKFGTTVRGHKEFQNTSCPGAYLWPRMSQLANAAQAVRTGKKPTPPSPAAPTPPAVNYNPAGFSAAYVRDIQTRLNKAGYSVGKSGVDGSLGPDTFNAVKAFQKANGLEVDGIPGPLTLAALKKKDEPVANKYITVQGVKMAPGTNYYYNQLRAAFKKATGLDLLLTSGYRTYAEQKSLYDRWKAGTFHAPSVAKPGTSLHESGRALDLRDSGSTPGVTVAGNSRSNWMKANAPKYGFNATGYNFREPWHFELQSHLNPWVVPGGSTSKPAPSSKLDVDGRFGPASTKRLQAVLGTLQDGVLSGQASVNKKYHPRLLTVQYGSGGSTAVRTLQGKLGVTKDAQIGPNTIKAWQRKLGVTADGYFGPNSATAAQNALNKGKLW